MCVCIFKGFAPHRRPFCQQAIADWLPAEMSHFLDPKLSFRRPWVSMFGSLGGHFGDPRIHRDTQWTTWDPDLRVSDFMIHFRSLLGSTLETWWWCFCDLRCQTGRQFAGPTVWWSGCGNAPWLPRLYVLKPLKTTCLIRDLFPLFHDFSVPSEGLGSHLLSVLVTLRHFFWFEGLLEPGL